MEGSDIDEDGLYILDEVDMGPDWDDEYERYRDDWSESLRLDIKQLFTEYVKDKHGYYFGADERFVEHAILCLAEVSDVHLLPELTGRVGAKKRVAPKIEFVEGFDELKEEVLKSEEVPVNIKP